MRRTARYSPVDPERELRVLFGATLASSPFWTALRRRRVSVFTGERATQVLEQPAWSTGRGRRAG